jgi:tight adherence protein B
VPAPVGTEFRSVADKMKIGRTMDAALQETARAWPRPNFSLRNQPRHPARDRRQPGRDPVEPRRGAAQALGDEAQDPRHVVGIQGLGLDRRPLPFIVFALIWFINGSYMQNFFVEPRLMIAGGIGLFWMSLGAFIMAKMVNFEI